MDIKIKDHLAILILAALLQLVKWEQYNMSEQVGPPLLPLRVGHANCEMDACMTAGMPICSCMQALRSNVQSIAGKSASAQAHKRASEFDALLIVKNIPDSATQGKMPGGHYYCTNTVQCTTVVFSLWKHVPYIPCIFPRCMVQISRLPDHTSPWAGM